MAAQVPVKRASPVTLARILPRILAFMLAMAAVPAFGQFLYPPDPLPECPPAPGAKCLPPVEYGDGWALVEIWVDPQGGEDACSSGIYVDDFEIDIHSSSNTINLYRDRAPWYYSEKPGPDYIRSGDAITNEGRALVADAYRDPKATFCARIYRSQGASPPSTVVGLGWGGMAFACLQARFTGSGVGIERVPQCEPYAIDVQEEWQPPPDPRRACCADNACAVVTAQECGMQSGQWFKDARVCSPGFCAAPPPPPPPAPNGACCLGNACELLTATQCAARNGDWVENAGICRPGLCASDPPEVRASDCSPVIGSWAQGEETVTLNADETAELFGYPYEGEWRCLESGGQPKIEIDFAEFPKTVHILISHEGEDLLCPDVLGAPITACAKRVDKPVAKEESGCSCTVQRSIGDTSEGCTGYPKFHDDTGYNVTFYILDDARLKKGWKKPSDWAPGGLSASCETVETYFNEYCDIFCN